MSEIKILLFIYLATWFISFTLSLMGFYITAILLMIITTIFDIVVAIEKLDNM